MSQHGPKNRCPDPTRIDLHTTEAPIVRSICDSLEQQDLLEVRVAAVKGLQGRAHALRVRPCLPLRLVFKAQGEAVGESQLFTCVQIHRFWYAIHRF